MRNVICQIILILLLVGNYGVIHAEDDFDKAIAKEREFIEKSEAILKTVKDKETAKAALPKLKAMDKERKQLLGSLLNSKNSQKSSKPEKEKDIELTKVDVATYLLLDPEVKRIKKIKEAYEILKEYYPISVVDEDERAVKIFQTEFKMVESYIEMYKFNNDKLPETLEELTKGKDPILPPSKKFLDLWDKPYHYDPKGPKNKGKKPDIWIETPSKKIIGNWEEEKDVSEQKPDNKSVPMLK